MNWDRHWVVIDNRDNKNNGKPTHHVHTTTRNELVSICAFQERPNTHPFGTYTAMKKNGKDHSVECLK